MAAKIFKHENRMAKALVTRGGLSARDAIAAAQRRVEDVRQPTLADIDATLALLYRLGRAPHPGQDGQAAQAKMYAAANRIVGTAAFFGLEQLGQAAYSLCELISRFQTTGRYSQTIMDIHLKGLRLLRHPSDHSSAQREAVLLGLHKLTSAL